MSRVADFGPLVVESDIDDAVCDLLFTWLPTHLAQIELERNMSNQFLRRPKQGSVTTTIDEDEFLDHRLPAILVTTSSTVGTPEKDGEGVYFAGFNVVVSSVVRGRNSPETRLLASLYGGAVRRIMVSMVGSLASECLWVAGNVAPVQDSTRHGRYLAASINQFLVVVDNVLQEGAGPLIPDPPENPYDPPDPNDPDTPYDPLVPVNSVDVDVTPLTE